MLKELESEVERELTSSSESDSSWKDLLANGSTTTECRGAIKNGSFCSSDCPGAAEDDKSFRDNAGEALW